MKQGHPLKGMLQRTITHAGEGGLFKKWASDLEIKMKGRGEYLVNKHMLKPLKIEDMVPAFYVLATGWFVSGIAFVIELTYLNTCVYNRGRW